jgi:hypothetical protein
MFLSLSQEWGKYFIFLWLCETKSLSEKYKVALPQIVLHCVELVNEEVLIVIRKGNNF